jgi:hypothetical protein
MLAADGVLLVEDWYTAGVADMVISAPTPEAADLFGTYQAVIGKQFETAGTDRRWARHGAYQAMLDEGLDEVKTEVYGQSWRGGGPGCTVLRCSLEQLRPRLLDAGLDADMLARVSRLLEDSRLHLWGFPLFSTSGWRV